MSQPLMHNLSEHDQTIFAEYFSTAPGEETLKEAHNLLKMVHSGQKYDVFAYLWNNASEGEKRSALLYLQEKRPDIFPATKADDSSVDGSLFTSRERHYLLQYFAKLAKNAALTMGRLCVIQNLEQNQIKAREAEMAGVAL